MTQTNRISGLTILDCMTELDEALVAEAELDAAFLPRVYTKAERRRARRDARRSKRESSAFSRFMNSGWGAAAASLLVALGIMLGIIYAVNHAPAAGPGPSGTISETMPTYDPNDILLGGTVPFAPEQADYTISTDPVIPADTTRLYITITAREPGTSLPTVGGWQLEKLVGPAWEGLTCNPEYAWEVPAVEGVYATFTHWIEIAEEHLTPGIYRLYAMEYKQKIGYEAVAYCEFAVDDEEHHYKTWTEADFADAAYAKSTYTLSADAKIPYGAKEIRLIFRANESMKSFTGPATCRLVKLDGTAGAGAAFRMDDELEFAVQLDAAPGSNATAACPATYEIINPAACTPGRYRIYNVNAQGVVYATCEFEIVGEALGWPGKPGEPDQEPVETQADTSAETSTAPPTETLSSSPVVEPTGDQEALLDEFLPTGP